MSRRSFWPTVLCGVAGSGVAAMAGHKHWFALHGDGIMSGGTSALERPEVGSLALVTLALWGVVLVTRGRVRRVVALFALVAALATLGFAVHGVATQSPVDLGWTGSTSTPRLERTAWGWFAIVGAAIAALAALVAVRQAPGWPEMGRKYDAPAAPAASRAPLEEQSALDVWKAMDEGVDPTADPSE